MYLEDVQQKRRRGRPAGRMTQRRWQVLEAYYATVASDQPLSWATIARECGLYDYREARRIVKDLQRLKKIYA